MKPIRPLATGLSAFIMAMAIPVSLHAGPCWGGWGYRGGYCGYGGWYGTGIPNGLGWSLFGLGAGAAIAAPVVASTVYARPVYPVQGYYYPPAPQTVVIHQSDRPVAPPNGTLAKAQSKLSALGYYKGIVDGSYGSQTERAVEQFQADNNLSVSGRLDLKTLSSLGISL
jgi:hypothetical protein